MIASRKLERLNASADEIRKQIPAGSTACLEVTQCNIRKEEEVKALMNKTLEKFGKIDFLVNNGGGQYLTPAASISLKGWIAVTETNLTGTFLCCREVYNQWMKENGGVIVNITMDMWKGVAAMSHSGAARAGVDNLTKTLAIEWAANGVRVNSVAPGGSIFSKSAALNYGSIDKFEPQIPRIPAKRLGTTEEVSAAVTFLLSPAAAFISGTHIIVDGAQTLYNTPNDWPIPGCQVMIASRNVDRLAEAAENMRQQIPDGSPAQIEFTQCSIRKEEQVKNLMKKTLEKFGKIDFLVNNGGGQFFSLGSDISLKGWNAVIETNLNGTFLCCREAYNQWMKENGGSIVNIIADMWKGFPMMSHTGAARAAVDNLTKTLALEWAANGVRINSVVPGAVYSETAAKNYGEADVFRRAAAIIPAKRVGTPEEIAAGVMFLLSPAAAFISGTHLQIDGAHTLFTTPSGWEAPDHDKMPAYTWEKDIAEQEQAAGTNTSTPKSKL